MPRRVPRRVTNKTPLTRAATPRRPHAARPLNTLYMTNDLSNEQRRDLLQLLYDYKGSFARSLAEMQVYQGYEHDIELVSNQRIFKRNYRLTSEDAAIAEKQIKEMVNLGIVEDTMDPYFNSPIFLVVKKNGEKRVIVDLRNLNSLIRPMLVQLPKVKIKVKLSKASVRAEFKSRSFDQIIGEDFRR